MKLIATWLVFSAAVVSAQVTSNANNTFTCAVANASYCAGDSLMTNIIIRCNGFVGQPGNCDDNLDGYPPLGDSFSPCYQTSPTSGDAACSKNCIVYGSSGGPASPNNTFSLSSCVQTSTKAFSSVPATTMMPASATVLTSIPAYTVPLLTNPGGPISRVSSSVSRISTAPGLPVNITVGSSMSTASVTTMAGGVGVTTTLPMNPSTSIATVTGTMTATSITVGAASTTSSSTPTFTGAAARNAGSVLAAGGLLLAYLM